MSYQSGSQNLRRNELADAAYNTFEWIRNNRQTFYSIAGITLGVIIFAAFFVSRYYLVRMRVSDKLSIAQALIYHNQTDQGVKLLDEVIAQYSDSPAAFTARLTKAEYLIGQRKYTDAKTIISYVITNGKPATLVPLAYPYMGNIQEDTQDFKGAVETYNDFLSKYPEHFLAPKILDSLARVYELSGFYDQAKTTYQKLAAEYKGSAWEQNSLAKLNMLKFVKSPSVK